MPIAGLWVLWFAGCADGVGEGETDRIHFTPLERDSAASRSVEVPDPPVSLDDRERLRRLVRKFRQRAPEFFARETNDRPVSETERLFLSAGEYLQLVAIYQRVVDRQGLESAAAPRLAWVLVRLGQQKQARSLLDELLEVQSDDAFVHFVDGAYWFNRAPQSQKAAARAVLAWRRVLEIDPEFEGPRRLNSRAMEQKIRQIENRLPKSPEALVAGGGDPPVRGARERGRDRDDVESNGDGAPGDSQSDAGASPRPDPGADASGRDAGVARDEDAGSDGTSETSTPVLVTRAELALGRGDLQRAERLFRRVLEDRGADRPDARFGLVRVLQRRGVSGGDLAERLRSLLNHPDVTASLAYEMGVFARSKLNDSSLVETCWERVRELDPSYAEQVGLGDE